ncbi:MAG: hypothetical protein ACSHXB_20785 [Sulfitobacter sp.]
MILKEIDYLLELEREILLRRHTRHSDLPSVGSQRVDAYAFIWGWYDRLVNNTRSVSEDQLKFDWQACMDEEKLDASDALVRLVYVYIEAAERLGLDFAQDNVALNVAQKQMAKWRDHKARRQVGKG